MKMKTACIVAFLLVVFSAHDVRSTLASSTTVFPPFKTYNVSMFMNTTEDIWSVKSSGNHTVWCRVDTPANITGNTIYFNRSFVDGGRRWVHQKYQGIVQDNATDIMFVGLQGTTMTTIEKLTFAVQNYSCGVFEVRLPEGAAINWPATLWYDMRVRNSSLSSIPTDCEKRFNETVSNLTIFPGYNDTCQTI
uniref:Lipocalin n=1 Tax=Rhipicephalus zambeziensis TaxID=60191 RepID=A0A224YCF6_9ACAR